MNVPAQFQKRLDSLGVLSADIEEKFIRGSGPGGQKINKTASTVVLRHRPTGTEVRVQRERSQAANREVALEELCAKLESALRRAQAETRSAVERERRRKRPKTRGQKLRMIAEKRRRSAIKGGRSRVGGDD